MMRWGENLFIDLCKRWFGLCAYSFLPPYFGKLGGVRPRLVFC
ncbi:MAG: hypothetical protein ACI81P_000710 [Neolewinella sp.]|jgi:hypothetical protein